VLRGRDLKSLSEIDRKKGSSVEVDGGRCQKDKLNEKLSTERKQIRLGIEVVQGKIFKLKSGSR